MRTETTKSLTTYVYIIFFLMTLIAASFLGIAAKSQTELWGWLVAISLLYFMGNFFISLACSGNKS